MTTIPLWILSFLAIAAVGWPLVFLTKWFFRLGGDLIGKTGRMARVAIRTWITFWVVVSTIVILGFLLGIIGILPLVFLGISLLYLSRGRLGRRSLITFWLGVAALGLVVISIPFGSSLSASLSLMGAKDKVRAERVKCQEEAARSELEVSPSEPREICKRLLEESRETVDPIAPVAPLAERSRISGCYQPDYSQSEGSVAVTAWAAPKWSNMVDIPVRTIGSPQASDPGNVIVELYDHGNNVIGQVTLARFLNDSKTCVWSGVDKFRFISRNNEPQEVIVYFYEPDL
jgi:hypothetical protein